MNKKTASEVVHGQILPLLSREQQRLNRIDRWLHWDPPRHRLPKGATAEHKALQKLAITPWPRLAVTTVAQLLFAERVYSADHDVAAMWGPWERNKFQSRQSALYKAALSYGQAFGVGLPSMDSPTRAVLRAYSPRESIAVYGDEVDDDFPMFFLREIRHTDGTRVLRLVDETASYFFGVTKNSDKGEFIEERPHGLGYCPAVRYANDLDLEGRTPGEVEPLIPLTARINKTDYDRLLAQHFTSWQVRTATNLDDNRSEEEKANEKMQLRQGDIMVGGEGVQFGTLPPTPLDGFIASRNSDIEAFAAISQTPPTTYGKFVNVSAEGLVEARTALYAKRDERKVSFGQSTATLLRIASRIEGRDKDAEDYSIHVGWADTEARTMSQTVDALGKAAQMLGVPARKLWDWIPNVDKATAEEWERYAQDNPSADMIQAQALTRQAEAVERQLRPTE